MQRYEIIGFNSREGVPVTYERKADDPVTEEDWVRYVDHAAMIAEKDRTIRALRESVKDILKFVTEDFPNGPGGPAVATDGYRSAYRGLLNALAREGGAE